MARVHPIAPGTHVTQKFTAGKHDGTDFRAAVGTPLYASQAGVVKTGSGHPRAGTWVEIHSGSTIVGYSHMSTRKVSSGQSVKAGQLIGYSGNTGNTTGPHLHFYVKVGGKFVDPVAWLSAGASTGTEKKVSVAATFPVLDLSKGLVTGEYVGILQALLLAKGYGPDGLVGKDCKPDKKGGAATKKYLGEFQVKTGTGTGGKADFVVGAKTWAALLK